MHAPLKMFVSYSHKDVASLFEFLPHLKTLERIGLATIWYDGMLAPGSIWNPGIERALEEARIYIPLISADFIASDYCMKVELPRALARQEADPTILVIPILVRPTALHAGLSPVDRQILPRGLKAVSRWANADEAWTEIVNEIRAAIGTASEAEISRWKGTESCRRALLDFRAARSKAICVFDDYADIGRTRDCDIPLMRGPLDIGKVHARLRYQPNTRQFTIEDLSSQNGTYVDGNRTRVRETLRTGCSIRLGGSLHFTFVQYRNASNIAGALIYADGEKELARYVLAPSRLVGVGTTSADAVRVPLAEHGVTAGFLDVTEGIARFIAPNGSEHALRSGDELRVLSRFMRIRFLP